MNPVLEFRDLSVTYRSEGQQRTAVNGVCAEVGEGETLGVAGESGCGKTTLALSVLRLLPRSARIDGQVLLEGHDVGELSWGRLRAVRWAGASLVFQGAMHALNPVRTIEDQIAEPMRLHDVGARGGAALRARVHELLDRVELSAERARAYPHELSGGQRQRVMIAMALACEPRLVIADEPTTALDVVVQAQVLGLLKRLVAEQSIAMMMISHDLSVLAANCARLVVMYQGSIVEQGRTEALVAKPGHSHTRALAAAFPTVGEPASRYVSDPDGSGAQRPVLLSARDVSVTFGRAGGRRHSAVRSVDLDVREQQTVALVGQSGSGKTTLARTLLGLQRADTGTVYFEGAPIPRNTRGLRWLRRRVQLILQDPTGALNPRYTVHDAVAEGLRVHGGVTDERQRVHEALEAAELRPAADYAARFPYELSGGQRQRVVIAGALVLNPAVLVADEPVASLDATVRGEILALLRRLRETRDLSTLVITHDLGVAWQIADRIAVMYAGRIVECGAAEQVLTEPRHEYTRTLLAAVPSSREIGDRPGAVGQRSASTSRVE